MGFVGLLSAVCNLVVWTARVCQGEGYVRLQMYEKKLRIDFRMFWSCPQVDMHQSS
jgi:hypothetical protein